MIHFLDLNPQTLLDWLDQRGHPPYRARQIRHWLFQRRAATFDEMSDLPKSLRAELAGDFHIWSAHVARHSQSSDGTEKLLLELADGGRIECVLLRDGRRRTICISTQVGCAMGCVFCASGLDGVQRNLSSGEIVEQMLLLARLLPYDERLSHIVVMGMGEPLANLDHLLPALEIASGDDGLGISRRHVTISTVGLPKAIHRLAKECPKFELAVSLHAPNDKLRDQLVPVNKNIGVQEIVAAADEYFSASGRRLTFEYVMLQGINDRPEQARELAALLRGRKSWRLSLPKNAEQARELPALLRGRPALLNLIPYNPVAGLPYKTPSPAAVRQFCEILTTAGVNVKVRQRKGDKIDAACGQLRRSTPATLSHRSKERVPSG